jgi:hypothetical protein
MKKLGCYNQPPPYHPLQTGYDEPGFYQEIDNRFNTFDDRLTSLKARQQEIRTTLHGQVE